MTAHLDLLMRFALALVMTALFGYGILLRELEGPGRDALVSLTTMAWMWFFGSSKGSSDKDRREGE
jgi:hypothetical protein